MASDVRLLFVACAHILLTNLIACTFLSASPSGMIIFFAIILLTVMESAIRMPLFISQLYTYTRDTPRAGSRAIKISHSYDDELFIYQRE
jgi:hypothetical protein